MSQQVPAPALAQRVADFIRRYPPFSFLTEAQLLAAAQSVSVRYLGAQQVVYAQGDDPQTHFFVIYKGAVRLFREEQGERLIDQLDEGDVFGIRPLIARQAYRVSARTSEETLLYALPIDTFGRLIEDNARVATYFATNFAHTANEPFVESARPSGRAAREMETVVEVGSTPSAPITSAELARVPVRRPAVVAHAELSIRDAARRMNDAGVGALVVVDGEQCPIGILTDRDLRRHVVTGEVALTAPVAHVMQRPVTTIAPDSRVVDVQLKMVRNRVHHLVVTLDGTPHTRVVGVLSNRDLLLALGSSPAAIVREVAKAKNVHQLTRLRSRADQWLRSIVEQRGSVYAAATIMTAINDEVTRRALRLTELELQAEGLAKPPLPFCWLSLGSQARGEQLLRTDQDHAIVVGDGDERAVEATRQYCLRLADRASVLLGEVGYERCVGDMMANNPSWCLSLAGWRQAVEHWLREPDGPALLNASTLLDRRGVYGKLALGAQLAEWTNERVRGQRLFLALLSKAALDNPPPLSFFRSFVVERGGEHEDEFDIKQRAMLPLADAARVLSLELGISDPPNTVDRFDRLAAHEPQNRELYNAAAQAYDTLMLFRARQGLATGGDGRYFQVRKLGKLERLQLRNAFGPTAQLLSALKLRFQVSMLNT